MRNHLLVLSLVLFAGLAWGQLVPQGFLDAATATDVRGWACLPSQPFRPLFLQIYVDNRLVGTTSAGLQRPDVAGVCGGNAFHGFSFTFPSSVQSTLSNGQPHTVQVFTQQTLDGVARTQLSNSPVTVLEQNAAPKGFLDAANVTGATGWACDPNNFGSALRVDFYIDNNVFAGSTVANLPREPAVGQQCGGNANHGFNFVFPQNIVTILANGQAHTIQAYAINIPGGNNPQLSGSPKTVQFTNRLPTGFLDVANATGVAGWACDVDFPTTALRVDVYIDNQFALSTTANLPREPAVGQQCGGNSNHGFSVNWPQSVLDRISDGQPHTVQVYAINLPSGQNPQLQNSPQTITIPRANTLPIGFLDIANGTLASGWTCDPDAPTTPLRVDIYIDNNFAVSTTANLPREPAVAQQCGGNPNHGFSITWPQSVLDILSNGQPHTVQAYAINVPTGQNPQLSGSPKTVTVPINTLPVGFFDVANGTLAAGWACDPDAPATPLRVDIYIDNQFALSTTANLPREPAVAQQCGGNPNHGFSVTWPQTALDILSNGQPHTVQAYAINVPTGQNPQLAGSPKTVTVPITRSNTLPVGFFDVANSTLASGWTCDSDAPTTALRVDIYIDNNFALSTTANLPREPAVAQQCGGNANHGFSVTWPQNILAILNDGQPHTVQAYAINVPTGPNPQLSGSPKTVTGQNLAPVGFLDAASRTSASGWACDPNNFNSALRVDIYVNGNTFAGSTTANLQREPAVGQQCGGNSNHGWSFTFPANIQQLLANGGTVAAYAINTPTGNNPQLSNSPKSV